MTCDTTGGQARILVACGMADVLPRLVDNSFPYQSDLFAMDVFINAVSGPGKGHRFALRDAQLVTIGRTGWADQTIEEDLKISGKHASLEIKGQYIVLVDLGSTNGTWFEDQAITQASLQPGQSFTLGDTKFEIEPLSVESSGSRGSETPAAASDSSPIVLPGGEGVENSRQPVAGSPYDSSPIVLDHHDSESVPGGGGPLSASEPPAMSAPTDNEGPAIIIPDDDSPANSPVYPPADPQRASESPIVIGDSIGTPEPPVPTTLRESAIMPAAGGAPENAFTVQKCPSDLFVHRFVLGEEDQPLGIVPDTLLRALYPTSTVVGLIHFEKFGVHVPEELADAEPLFHWVDDRAAAQAAGPVIVESHRHPGIGPWLQQGWGQDAVICIATRDTERLRPHLLKLITTNLFSSDSRQGSLFGYCWPSVMGQLLELQSKQIVDKVLPAFVDSVLFEIPGTQGGWQLFARQRMTSALESIGFVHQEAQEVAG